MQNRNVVVKTQNIRPSLGLDLAILLDVDMLIGLENANFVFWELDTGRSKKC